MITKEQIKNEVDKLPDSLLEEVFTLLRRISKKGNYKEDSKLKRLEDSIDKFTSDFMNDRNQQTVQIRESFD